jgi:hypothetical protein
LLTFGDASGLAGIVITEAPTLIQACTYIAARGIDNGAPFAKGHVLSPDLMASVLPTQIDRMLNGANPLLGAPLGKATGIIEHASP